MRIAVQTPMFLYGDIDRNYNGYAIEFVRRFKPVLYLPGTANLLSRGALFKYRLQTKSSVFRPFDFEYAYSVADLNRKADVLICFNGFPYHEWNAPPRGFRGLKVFHAFEYVFHARESNRLFEQAGVDYLMGYADHSRHCAFFNEAYPRYRGKVIPVPFGFGRRFLAAPGGAQRTNKVVALGAVNPVDDPTVEDRAALADYRNFYSAHKWTHAWRNRLREHAAELADVMDCYLPRCPKTNNPDYDAVEMMGRYAMFANDEGLMAFPPARTYEGTAAGSAMVSSDHACFKDLGFSDGENCIMHRSQDIDDFRDKAGWYIRNPQRLREVADRGTAMVRARYSHEQVARDLYEAVRAKVQA